MTALSDAFGPDTVLGYAKARVGHTGAAAGLISVLSAALSLYRHVLPATPKGRGWGLTHLCDPTPWVRDRVDGPRRAGVLAVSRGASCSHVILEELEAEKAEAEAEAESPRTETDARAAWRGDLPLNEGLFVVEGGDSGEIVAGLQSLVDAATETAGPRATESHRPAVIHRLAKDWWERHPNRPDARLAITLIAREYRRVERPGSVCRGPARAGGELIGPEHWPRIFLAGPPWAKGRIGLRLPRLRKPIRRRGTRTLSPMAGDPACSRPWE